MSVRRALGLALAVSVLLLAFASPSGAASGRISVSADRAHVTTKLGKKFAFRTTIANESGSATESLVAHLNILSLRPGVYVDPEDWSSERTRYVGTIPAGESRTITWTIHAVNSGHLAAYVTVLPQSGLGQPTTSTPLVVAVAHRNTLNSGGILPLALAVPLAIGLLAAGLRVRRRQR